MNSSFVPDEPINSGYRDEPSENRKSEKSFFWSLTTNRSAAKVRGSRRGNGDSKELPLDL
jgi:hypothetical protein